MLSVQIPQASPESTKRLESLIGGDVRIRIRKMFGQPAGFVNGNLCLGTFGADLFVRLSGPDVRALSKVAGVRPFEPMPGRPMKQYLVLPEALLRRPAEAKKWVGRSVDYVLSLPPK